jgi:hypothetical protein
VTPAQFQALINTINHHLQLANSTGSTVWENVLAVLTWHTSLIWYTPRFEREMRNIEKIIEQANTELWSSKGLSVLSPRDVALQYVSPPSLGAICICFKAKYFADLRSWRYPDIIEEARCLDSTADICQDKCRLLLVIVHVHIDSPYPCSARDHIPSKRLPPLFCTFVRGRYHRKQRFKRRSMRRHRGIWHNHTVSEHRRPQFSRR